MIFDALAGVEGGALGGCVATTDGAGARGSGCKALSHPSPLTTRTVDRHFLSGSRGTPDNATPMVGPAESASGMACRGGLIRYGNALKGGQW